MFPRTTTVEREVPPPPPPPGIDRSRLRSGSAGRAAEALPHPHVLLLRTFGRDGDTKVGNSRDGPRYTRRTLEEFVGEVADEAGFPVWWLHDEKLNIVPGGINSLASTNDEWFEDVLRFMETAVCAVVLADGSTGIGDSFARELEAIRNGRLRFRTVLLFPPSINDDARAVKERVLPSLGWPNLAATPLITWRSASGPGKFVPSIGPDDDSLADHYLLGLRTSFEEIVAMTHVGRSS